MRQGSKRWARRSAGRTFFSSATWRTVLPVRYASLAISAAASYPISGASAVHMARLCSILTRHRSGLALRPSTQRTAKFSVARARSQPPDVVGNLHETDRHGPEGTAGLHQRILGGLGFKVVLRFLQRTAGLAGQQRNHALGELRMGVQACADGGAP